MRVNTQLAYILHKRAFGESSQILEVFTRDHGRVCLMSKGSRSQKSRTSGILQSFRPLLIGWQGRGEMPTLCEVDSAAISPPPLAGKALLSAVYLNELLMHLLHRDDPHEALFVTYRAAIAALATAEQTETVLRSFECRLLGDIGYGPVLERDADNAPIEAQTWYDYVAERGPVRLAEPDRTRAEGVIVRGATLIALARNELTDTEVLRESKRLMRVLLARHLGDKPLHSRKLFHGIAAGGNREARG